MAGHAPGCTFIGPLPGPPPRYPWGDQPWLEHMLERKAAAKAAANGKAGHTAAPRRPYTDATTRTPEECEAWAQKVIDDEIDEAEADPPGTRNDELNKHALRCFRVAMAADFELDDVYDALVGACRVNGLIDDDGIRSVHNTLRSARRKADEDGPAYPGDPILVDEVDAEHFEQ
jgi:hypothetical protein